jgi:hypothetical protein
MKINYKRYWIIAVMSALVTLLAPVPAAAANTAISTEECQQVKDSLRTTLASDPSLAIQVGSAGIDAINSNDYTICGLTEAVTSTKTTSMTVAVVGKNGALFKALDTTPQCFDVRQHSAYNIGPLTFGATDVSLGDCWDGSTVWHTYGPVCRTSSIVGYGSGVDACLTQWDHTASMGLEDDWYISPFNYPGTHYTHSFRFKISATGLMTDNGTT